MGNGEQFHKLPGEARRFSFRNAKIASFTVKTASFGNRRKPVLPV
jgi:hypothetical protein